MMYSSEGVDLLTHLATEHAYLTEAAGTPEFIKLIKNIIEQFKDKKQFWNGTYNRKSSDFVEIPIFY